MPPQIEIQPTGPIVGTIRPPGSKSITNRALVCAALADGESTLSRALDSEDTRVMIGCLRKLGVAIDVGDAGETLRVHGTGGRFAGSDGELFVANSGTTIRFLTAMVTVGLGTYRLHGIERMHSRPIGDLLDALKQLGANVRSEHEDGCPPVIVHANGLPGGLARVRGDISSQYLSGLLMASPYAASGVQIQVDGELVSKPYVEMTLEVMRAFGVVVDYSDDLTQFKIDTSQHYQPREYNIEPDASAASYFWAAAAVTGGKVSVEGLSPGAMQGDVAFCECLEQMGCSIEYGDNEITVIGSFLRGINVNMNAISDTVQTLAAVALFAAAPTTITGVAHIRHKETDRIGDLACELRKFGATVEELPDGLRITPPQELQTASIETYNDHRMAMSLALVGLRTPGVVINNPQCTEKTYPNFFADLDRLAGQS